LVPTAATSRRGSILAMWKRHGALEAPAPDARRDEPDAQGATATIELRLPDLYGARTVAVAGDFTAWVPVNMPRRADGQFGLDLVVPTKRRWRYRLCLDGTTWMNDPDADDFDLDERGAGVSVRCT